MFNFQLPRWRVGGLSHMIAAEERASRGLADNAAAVDEFAELLRREHLRREAAAEVAADIVDPVPSTQPIPRFLAIVIGAAGIVIALMGLREVKDIVTPVFLAVNLMIVAYPVQAWLVRRGIPRAIAAIVVCLVILAGLVGFFWAIGWALAVLIAKLPEYSGKFVELYDLGLRQLARGGISEEQVFSSAKRVDPKSLTDIATSLLSGLQGTLTLLGLMVTAVLFIMMDSVGIERRIRIATHHHPSLFVALDSFTTGVRKYWLVSTVFGLIIASLDVAALWMLGVPLALVWGLLSFVTNYIPNVGFVIGLVPPALLALLDGGWFKAVAVVIAYWTLNFVVQSVIQPKVAGDAIGVTATISFFSLFFWGYVLGLAGALIALPATLLVKAILVDGDATARWVNLLIASDPGTAVPEGFTEDDWTAGGRALTEEGLEEAAEDDVVDDVGDRVARGERAAEEGTQAGIYPADAEDVAARED